MKKTILLLFVLGFVACGNIDEKKSKMANDENSIQQVKMAAFIIENTGKNNIVSGDILRFKYAQKTNQTFDSISVNIAGVEFSSKVVNDSIFEIETDKMSVGLHTISINIYGKNGYVQNENLRIKILSDIIPESYTYRVKKEFKHNIKSYTQGLEFDGNILYEGTGLYGESTLSRIDLDNNDVICQINISSEVFGEGVTILNNKVYQLTWKESVGYVYDKETLKKINEFSYPTEGWGLCNDGSQLIMTDGTENVRFLDTIYMQEKRRVQVYDTEGFIDRLNELEFIDGLVYANVYGTNNIVVFEPETGKVVKSINLQGILKPKDIKAPVDVLNGIAYDVKNDRLIVTGKWWPKMYEIELIKK